MNDDLPDPLDDDPTDDGSLQFIALAASRSRDTLLSGITALRNMEPGLDPVERQQAAEMIEKIGHLILAWDELLRQTDTILTRTQPELPHKKPLVH